MNVEHDFYGVIPALPTPFTKSAAFDEEGARRLIRYLCTAGVHGFVIAGSTGEMPTLTLEEIGLYVELVKEQRRPDQKIIVSAGSNSTSQALDRVEHAQSLGVDGLMIVVPYYNKPQQKGLIQHFSTLADASSLPIIMYNVPGRTSVNMLPETVAALAEHPRIVALKDASHSLEQGMETLRLVGDRMSLLSGEDAMFAAHLALGMRGSITVTGNLVPHTMVEMYDQFQANRMDLVRARQLELLPLIEALFLETNPVPLKCALADMKLIEPYVRSPLVEADERTRSRLRMVMPSAEKIMNGHVG